MAKRFTFFECCTQSTLFNPISKIHVVADTEQQARALFPNKKLVFQSCMPLSVFLRRTA